VSTRGAGEEKSVALVKEETKSGFPPKEDESSAHRSGG